MVLVETQQDLFEVDKEYTLVHCISLDCRMGAGVALDIDKKFPKMKLKLIEYIRLKKIDCPTCIGYSGYPTTIMNLITKRNYYDKPTKQTMLEALCRLREICTRMKISKLAMPKIGCGLDKMKWIDVKAMIDDVFGDIDIEILVCYL